MLQMQQKKSWAAWYTYVTDEMIPGSKGHAFHACMKKQGFGTHKT